MNRNGDFITSASFWVPDQIPSSAWIEHGPFAFWIVEALQPHVIVELGTSRGFSYLAFCQSVQRLGLATRCYAVDTWQGDEHAGFYEEEVYQVLREYHDKRYSPFSELVRSTFDEAAEKFADGSIDLLHIDGRHFYDDVKHDFLTWLPKISDRGVVLFHDTTVRERDFGVFKLWGELCGEYPHFEFIHGHGLGILGIGEALPELVQQLFLASMDASLTKFIRDAYERLGTAIRDRIQNEGLMAKNKRMEERLSKANERIADLNSKINSFGFLSKAVAKKCLHLPRELVHTIIMQKS